MALLLQTTNSLAQNKYLEYSFQKGTQSFTTKPTAVTNGWMLPYNSGDCFPDKIIYINSKSHEAKYLPLAGMVNFPLINIYDILQAGANEFVCAGLYNKNIDVSSMLQPMIYTIDSTGNVLWRTYFEAQDLPGKNVTLPFKKLVQAPDGSIYAFAPNSYLAKIDANGHKVWLKAFPDGDDILWSFKGLIMSGANHIWELDSSGIIVKDNVFSNDHVFSTLHHGTGNDIITQNWGTVFIINSNTKITDSFQFQQFHFLTKSLKPITFYAADSNYYFAQLDSMASYSYKGKLNWKTSIPGNSISGFALARSIIAVAGNGPTPFLKTFDKSGDTDPIKRDIGVINIIPLKVTSQPTPGSNDSFKMRVITADIDVVVKNFSTETIHSFYLQSLGTRIWPRFNCQEITLLNFTRLNIAPGDSARVHLGNISRYDVTPGTNGYPYYIAVSTVSPNDKIDATDTNNIQAITGTLTTIKPNPTEHDFQIYPNPSSGVFYLDNISDQHAKVIVYDITGKQVFTKNIISQHNIMDISEQPDGMYFISIHTDNGVIIKKLIKQ